MICSAESTTQVKAIAEYVEQELSSIDMKSRGIEGLDYSHWVLIDYGDVIIHIFEKETRHFYDLEKLWMDAPLVELNESTDYMGGKNKRAVHT